ncbi:MAG: DUF1549 domain-containing protein [Acidobacteria bacterium]|nr:DUF1549 domain-containing protein [Acidobacteriota bacterium]MCB9396330.1 DUF1549 domain-containing protein [Acidobacteriota bacterium]
MNRRSMRTLIVCLLGAALFAHEGMTADACSSEATLQNLNQQTQLLFKGQSASAKAAAQPINEIDDQVFAKWKELDIPTNGICDDATFLRRASLILTGRIPDPNLTRSFLTSTNPNKRDDLIDSLMKSEAFETHWAFWFQEMFQVSGRILRGGRDIYDAYFKQVVQEDKPMDQMAYEILTTLGQSDLVPQPNFYVRANDTVRVVQDFYDNAAIHAAQKFLGLQIECISCHDGAYHLENINLFLADKKREDLWAMAAYFSELQRRPATRSDNLILSLLIAKQRGGSQGYLAESDTGDRPAREGGLITPRYLLDDSKPATGAPFLETFAEKIIGDRQFARNFANRFWAHCFGMGMVEPIDAMDPLRIDANLSLPEGWDYQSSDLALLEFMTDLFIQSNYQFKPFLRKIVSSATFQMDSQFNAEWDPAWTPYYARYMAKRLSAESVYDSLVVGTGVATQLANTGSTRDAAITRVFYAHELLDTDQPRGGDQTVTSFLDTFGRGNRYDIPRSPEGSIAQALLMMNSGVVNSRLLAPISRISGYLQQRQSAETIVDNLYLDLLVRMPTAEEKATLLEAVSSFSTTQDQAAAAVWLLVNKLEFLFVY